MSRLMRISNDLTNSVLKSSDEPEKVDIKPIIPTVEPKMNKTKMLDPFCYYNTSLNSKKIKFNSI